jgi:hypothetical protein
MAVFTRQVFRDQIPEFSSVNSCSCSVASVTRSVGGMQNAHCGLDARSSPTVGRADGCRERRTHFTFCRMTFRRGGVAALEHRESVVAVGHLVAPLQRGYRHRAAARCWREMVGRTIPGPPSNSTVETRRVKDNAPYLQCIIPSKPCHLPLMLGRLHARKLLMGRPTLD